MCGWKNYNTLIIKGMATKVPKELPRLVKTTTSSIRVILFFQKPLMEMISSDNLSKSLTFGFLENASTSPDTQPAAIIGFSEVKGAAKTDERMVNG